MRTYIVSGYFTIVHGADTAIPSERSLQTFSTEEVTTLGLHWVPHGGETDGTLVSLQKMCHESCRLKTAHHRSQRDLVGRDFVAFRIY